VYRKPGDIYIDLGQHSTHSYIVEPKNKIVGIPGNCFIAKMGFIAVAKEYPPEMIVDLSVDQNDSKDPKLVITDSSIIFLDNIGKQVCLTW
jgi:hypothetical protein